MKTAYFIDSMPAKGTYTTEDYQEKFRDVGENTGNCVYVNGLRRQIDYEIETLLDDPRLKEGYGVGVMPVSNILRGRYEGVLKWVDAIEKLNFPVVLVGMGAQSYWDIRTPRQIVDSLKPEVIRAFQRIANQCCSFGIRGEETAECLDLMGIHNYRIIGCPSFYHYLDGVFPGRKQPTREKVLFSLVTRRKTTGKVFEMGMQNKGQWVMQALGEGARYLYSNENVSDEFVKERLVLDVGGGRNK